jgi:hypothetical protein
LEVGLFLGLPSMLFLINLQALNPACHWAPIRPFYALLLPAELLLHKYTVSGLVVAA